MRRLLYPTFLAAIAFLIAAGVYTIATGHNVGSRDASLAAVTTDHKTTDTWGAAATDAAATRPVSVSEQKPSEHPSQGAASDASPGPTGDVASSPEPSMSCGIGDNGGILSRIFRARFRWASMRGGMMSGMMGGGMMSGMMGGGMMSSGRAIASPPAWGTSPPATSRPNAGRHETDATENGQPVREITITASRWQFSPSVVRVPQGSRVRLILRSTDVNHGFGLFAYNINERIPSRRSATVEFTASEAGEYLFACTQPCGPGHASMRGVLVVEDEDAHDGVATQESPAPTHGNSPHV